MSAPPFALVWNPGAGSADGVALERVQAALPGTTVHACSDGRNPVHCAEAALATGAAVIVAAGGDGTVSAVAGALIAAGSHSALGVLPLGTSNSFAAALGIPDEPEAALALLASPARRTIDAARVTTTEGTRTMVLHCMIGLHADAIADTSGPAKRRWGVLAYLASTVKRLVSLEPFHAELVTPDARIRCSAVAIGAANLAPAKTVLAQGPSHVPADDGLVEVTIVAAESFAEAVATSLHLYRSAREGEPAQRDNVGSFAAATVEVTTEPPQRVLLDGEPFGTTPVSVASLPGVLVVIAPPDANPGAAPAEADLAGLPDLDVEPR